MCLKIRIFCIVFCVFWMNIEVLSVNINRTAEGYAAGFLSNCKGSEKPALIPRRLLNNLFFVVEATSSGSKGTYRKSYNYFNAAEGIPNDPHIDLKNKRTVVFVSGFMDTTFGPIGRIIAGVYNRKNYNVLLLDTHRFTTYIYTVAARLTRDVGRRAAMVLAKMTSHGLDPKRTELIGLSLGGQVVSYIAKNFRKYTGTNLTRITGLDPAGPCFRNLPSDDRIDASDADRVDIVHTNIDGYGMATPAGHVDFYVNGGEYQPSDIKLIPCTMLCSHVKAYLYWLVSLQFPKAFIGMRCETVQEARDAGCYDRRPRVTNVMGLETNFEKPGIFYLSTTPHYPYYLGADGLDKQFEVWPLHSYEDNKGDLIV